MPELPDDIIEDILSRLQGKSLSRFKSVSNYWFSLISDTHFIKRHLNQAKHSNNFRLMLTYPFYSIDCNTLSHDVAQSVHHYYSSIPHHPLRGATHVTVDIMGSCDGLLCLTFGKHYEEPFAVCLWNPTTNETKKLPAKPPSESNPYKLWTPPYAFGYDPIIQDYKVITFKPKTKKYFFDVLDTESVEYEVDVYTVRTDTWHRKIKHFPWFYSQFERSPGVFLNGALHWLRTDPTKDTIVSLGVVDEELKEVPKPDRFDGLDSYDHPVHLGVLDGCLCVTLHGSRDELELWFMKNYGLKDSWTKQFTILKTEVSPPFWHSRPICFSNIGEILLGTNDGLFLYDPKHKKGRILQISRTPKSIPSEWSRYICVYMETLVSLTSGTQGEQRQKKGKGKQEKNAGKISSGSKVWQGPALRKAEGKKSRNMSVRLCNKFMALGIEEDEVVEGDQ